MRAPSAALACMLLALLGACRGGRTTAPAAPEDDEGRFPHRLHAEIACTDCHALSDVLAGEPAIVGRRDHAACDRAGCHATEFAGPPGSFCLLCHERVDPDRAGGSPLAPYPPERGRRALAADFSHASHLDFGRMESRVGFHVSCADCHEQTDAIEGALPDHRVCARCHAPEAAAEGVPPMTRCDGCHKERPRQPARARRLIAGDLRFSHRQHLIDRGDRPIRCIECHTESALAERPGGHAPPPTAACVGCHDDQRKTPPHLRMSRCETCHATRAGGLRSIPPRSHLPAGERPADHTLAFRRDHAAEAERDSLRCARCHTFMSGSRRGTCDQCHQTMRPGDHVVTWREFDHGREAAARSDRCSVCHAADYCVACHRQPPRSHFPRVAFVDGGHSLQARMNPRACLTCHQQELCADCHGGGRARPARGAGAGAGGGGMW